MLPQTGLSYILGQLGQGFAAGSEDAYTRAANLEDAKKKALLQAALQYGGQAVPGTDIPETFPGTAAIAAARQQDVLRQEEERTSQAVKGVVGGLYPKATVQGPEAIDAEHVPPAYKTLADLIPERVTRESVPLISHILGAREAAQSREEVARIRANRLAGLDAATIALKGAQADLARARTSNIPISADLAQQHLTLAQQLAGDKSRLTDAQIDHLTAQAGALAETTKQHVQEQGLRHTYALSFGQPGTAAYASAHLAMGHPGTFQAVHELSQALSEVTAGQVPSNPAYRGLDAATIKAMMLHVTNPMTMAVSEAIQDAMRPGGVAPLPGQAPASSNPLLSAPGKGALTTQALDPVAQRLAASQVDNWEKQAHITDLSPQEKARQLEATVNGTNEAGKPLIPDKRIRAYMLYYLQNKSR